MLERTKADSLNKRLESESKDMSKKWISGAS
jgi:hypothetical protein